MALPLLATKPITTNARVANFLVANEESPRQLSGLAPARDAAAIDAVIEQAYRQIYFHAFKVDRDPVLEMRLRSGQINVRDAVRRTISLDQGDKSYRLDDEIATLAIASNGLLAVDTRASVAMRLTRVRDIDGVVWHVPNGEIRRVGNKSQGWAVVNIDVPLNIFQESAEVEIPDPDPAVMQRAPGDLNALDQALDLLLAAKRPVILVGQGGLIGEAFAQLRPTPREPRHHGAHRHVEYLGDFQIRMIFEVKQHQRRAERLVHAQERLHHGRPVEVVHHGRADRGQLVLDGFQLVLRETRRAAARLEEFAMQRREQPGLDLGAVAELLALGGPEEKRLLRQVTRLGHAAGEAQRKAVKRLIVVAHQLLEIQFFHAG